ncbi:MAG: FAD-binding oxidoreductase [Clostridia bacterium]|nr:FAD-binding oxidoreductase [Clostridia bacterium]
MQLTDGNLYFQKNEKIKNTYPYLSHDINCEILIIGGGITGAITAFFLAKEGFDIVVVEKNIVGYGSTSANTGILEYQVDIELNKLEKLIGANYAKRIYKLCYEALEDIQKIMEEIDSKLEFKRKDTIYFSNKFIQKSNMLKEYELRKELGFDMKFLDGHKIIDINTGILTKGSSATINTYKLTQEIFIYLSKLDNVRIYENTRVDNIKAKFDYVECRTNNNFRIHSDKMIFTSGFETLKHLKNVPVELYKTFTLVSKQVPELKEIDINFTAKNTLDPHNYIRFTEDGRIVYGGEDVKLTEKFTNEKYLENLANSKYKKLYVSMQKTFYNLNEVPIEYAYNGTFGYTKDTLPIIDELDDMPNCFCNLSFGSNGVLYSVLGAKILKDAVDGYYTKDINMFKVNR